MGFMDFLGQLGSGFSSLFGGGGGQAAPAWISDPGGLQPMGDYSNLNVAGVTPGDGAGFWSGLGGGAADLAKSALGQGGWLPGVVQLGATGLGAASSIMGMQRGAEQNEMLRQEQRRLASIAAPAAQAGGALTAAGQQAILGGSLPAQLETMVQAYENDIKMKYRQYLSDQGLTDSSTAVQLDSWIAQEVAKYRQSLAESLLQQGYGGIQSALGPSGTAAYTAAGALGANQRDLAQGASALGKLMSSTG